jgi:hypothetical protein
MTYNEKFVAVFLAILAVFFGGGGAGGRDENLIKHLGYSKMNSRFKSSHSDHNPAFYLKHDVSETDCLVGG